MGPVRVRGFAKVAADGTTARVAVPSTTVLLVANTALYWNPGDSDVEAAATDYFLPARVPLWVELPSGTTHIAALEAVTDSEGILGIYGAY